MDALIDILFLPPAFANPFTICVLISTAMLMVASSLPKTLHRSICHTSILQLQTKTILSACCDAKTTRTKCAY